MVFWWFENPARSLPPPNISQTLMMLEPVERRITIWRKHLNYTTPSPPQPANTLAYNHLSIHILGGSELILSCIEYSIQYNASVMRQKVSTNICIQC